MNGVKNAAVMMAMPSRPSVTSRHVDYSCGAVEVTEAMLTCEATVGPPVFPVFIGTLRG